LIIRKWRKAASMAERFFGGHGFARFDGSILFGEVRVVSP
jgi:hypothetical protein